jgi:2',3'-cyclic-nucleotide 2'-phosphodiesterase / 3'-nucleotidase / 5'-nucleotidase
VGYAYTLANGTQLTGARVSYFDVDRKTRDLCGAGMAYDTIYDRYGLVVTDAAQVNESGHPTRGLARLCSAQLVERGDYGFRDTIFFTGEENGNSTEWALDVANGDLWACPDLGRGSWENVTPVDTGCKDTIALLLGDDTAPAPLYLYVGTKGKKNAGFLARNGLTGGTLHVWVADNGDTTPVQFNTEGSFRSGRFVAIPVKDASHAGDPGYDAQGYLDRDTLKAAADAVGAFTFSRPEDLATNPHDGRQVVFASTGRDSLFGGADSWGTIYVVELGFGRRCRCAGAIDADITIVHDADGLLVPDSGIRSPDNLVWSDNGYVYVQEDRSIGAFGSVTGRDASIWQLDPWSGAVSGVAEMDRSVVAPGDATDSGAGDIGNWESSGVIDVTRLFKTDKGETLLLAVVQAHGIRDGSIGGNANLAEGGQILLLSKDFDGACKGRHHGR